ncbi:HIT-like protein [Panaeolus papilionaceus]|nr:HIT-like protein [Panaeolus papilionaceus]
MSQKSSAEDYRQPLETCKFCFVEGGKGFSIMYEDGDFVAFSDRKPASTYHYLVVPKAHIASVRSLRQTDVELVKAMEKIGNDLLESKEVPSESRRMGFHIPPFNSVYHLHLHVQGLPYLSAGRAAKYPYRMGEGDNSKGLTWFAEVKQVIRILEQGKRVGVMPC